MAVDFAPVDDQAARRVVGVAARPAVALDDVVAILRPLAGGAEVKSDAPAGAIPPRHRRDVVKLDTASRLAPLDRYGRERAAASGRYPRLLDAYRAADLVSARFDLREAGRARGLLGFGFRGLRHV